MGSPRQIGLAAIVLGLVADQLHKWYMLGPYGITETDRVPVLPFMDWVLVWNRGVSYGLFQQDSDLGRWMLIGIGIAASIFFAWWMWTSKRALAALAFGLIAGGGLSNAIDRVVHGAVVDNFQFHYGGYEWYVFNLADVWISAGVVGVLLVWLTERPENAVDG